MLLAAIFRQSSRGLNIRARYTNKFLPCNSQQLHFSTTTLHMFHHRISTVSESTHQKLRKDYNLSDEFFVIYKEPKHELKHMIILKYSELVIYASPLISVFSILAENETFESFIRQDDFFIGVAIVCLYVLGIRFVANGFVKIIFHNRTKDIYRAFVLNKYKPTYKYVDFKAKDLKVINLHPDIPMARNFFKAGKQHFILHDELFATRSEQDKLIGEAIEKWHAHWGR